jgi:hypothetical protein
VILFGGPHHGHMSTGDPSTGDPSTGDDRLEAVGETIEDAKKAADVVSEQEDLDLHHRDRPDPAAAPAATDDQPA